MMMMMIKDFQTTDINGEKIFKKCKKSPYATRSFELRTRKECFEAYKAMN
jgi:hypothetical protein